MIQYCFHGTVSLINGTIKSQRALIMYAMIFILFSLPWLYHAWECVNALCLWVYGTGERRECWVGVGGGGGQTGNMRWGKWPLTSDTRSHLHTIGSTSALKTSQLFAPLDSSEQNFRIFPFSQLSSLHHPPPSPSHHPSHSLRTAL